MSNTEDDIPPAVTVAASLLDGLADGYDLNEADVDREHSDGIVEFTLTWTEDDIHRTILLTAVTDNDALQDEYPPDFIVEYSAWSGPRDGPAEANARGFITDAFDPKAVSVSTSSIITAFRRLQEITHDDLNTVPERYRE